MRINSLLASEAEVKELLPEHEQRIKLAAGLKCHYKIPSFGQSVPLKICLTSCKNIGSAYLFISQVFERPKREVSEQIVLIKSKRLNVFFKGNEKEKFNKSWIYLTLECEREFAGTLLVEFGKVKFHKVTKANTNERTLMTVKTNDEETKKVFFKFKRPLKLPPSTIKSSIHSKTKTSEEIIRHRLHVKTLKEEREDEEMCNMILKLHRRKIQKMLDDLVHEKLKEIESNKKSYMSWIGLSKLFKITYILYHKQKRAMREKKNIEKKIQKLVRINVFIKGKFSIIDSNYQKRIQKKLNTYYFC